VSVITPSRSRRTASYRSEVTARSVSGCGFDRSLLVSLKGSSSFSLSLLIATSLIEERPVPDLDRGHIAVKAEDA